MGPQTLDIGHLIASPSESPFAKALASATHVLVVPNQKGSIYERAWCTYEAYLACKWGKTLVVASLPVFGLRWQVFVMLLVNLVSAAVHVALFGSCSVSVWLSIVGAFGSCSVSVWLSIVGALEVATIILPSSFRI